MAVNTASTSNSALLLMVAVAAPACVGVGMRVEVGCADAVVGVMIVVEEEVGMGVLVEAGVVGVGMLLTAMMVKSDEVMGVHCCAVSVYDRGVSESATPVQLAEFDHA